MKNIGIIGLGYVGLPLALNFGKSKNCVVYGFDNDILKLKSILKGKSYLSHINDTEIRNFPLNYVSKLSKLKKWI